MPGDDEQALLRTLTAVRASLSALGVDPDSVSEAPARTLGEDSPAPLEAPEIRRRLAAGERLELGALLGQGGMGLVHEGSQLVLDRGVAVKSLRPELRGTRAEKALLWEAQVTGALEHPNVVPVHDIVLGEDGEALVVLKRIEGQSLQELLEDPEAMRRLAGGRELLDWQLAVLDRIADALRFAHSRGIVHRDLKPENVMIGGFGEVYLLDWGIAASFRPDGGSLAPSTARSEHLAGTPAYMAPEMLGGRGEDIGPWTDVYLLGALLYQLLTGSPPHTGDNLRQIIASIALSEPELPEAVSPELAAIVRRAMSADIADRFQDVESFAAALSDYREHRGSERIAERARGRLAELEEIVAAISSVNVSMESAAPELAGSQDRAVRLFAETRYAFRQALEAWSGNARARDDLRRATELMVRFELARKSPRAALARIKELEEPPRRLARAVEAAIAEERSRKRQLERLRADRDVGRGRRARVGLVLAFGVLWVAFPVLPRWLGAGLSQAAANLGATAFFGACLAVLLGLLYLRRDLVRQTSLNRAASLGVVLILLAHAGTHAAACLAGIPFAEALRYHFIMWVALSAMSAITAEKMSLIVSAIYGIGGLLAAGTSLGTDSILLACNAGLVIYYAVLWSLREDEGDRSLAAAIWGAPSEEPERR